MSKKKIARKNLKKTIYFTSGIGLSTVALGVGVSVPIYYKVNEQLSKQVSKIRDLTKYMSQLTTKLGVSPDEKFVKTLKNGYVLVYENGETQIYRKDGDGDKKTLVLNMNEDGTVGSAADYTGPAAQGLLGIVQSAQSDLEGEAEAMNQVLSPFTEEVEQKSLKVESAVTGLSVDELKARNILATKDKEKAEENLRKLQEEVRKAGRPDINVDKAKQAANEAKSALEEDSKLADDENSNDAFLKKQIELQQKMKAAEEKLKEVYRKSLTAFFEQWKGKLTLDQVQKIDPNDFADVKVIIDYDVIKLLQEYLKNESVTLSDLKNSDKAVNNLVSIIVSQMKAKETKTRVALEKGGENKNIFKKITSNTDSLISALIRSLGFKGKHGEEYLGSDIVRDKLIKYASSQGFDEKFLNSLINYIKKIGSYDSTIKRLTKKVVFTQMIDTYNFVDEDINNMLIYDFSIYNETTNGKMDILHNNIIFSSKNKNRPNQIYVPSIAAEEELNQLVNFYGTFENPQIHNSILKDIDLIRNNKKSKIMKYLKPYINPFLGLKNKFEGVSSYEKLIIFLVKSSFNAAYAENNQKIKNLDILKKELKDILDFDMPKFSESTNKNLEDHYIYAKIKIISEIEKVQEQIQSYKLPTESIFKDVKQYFEDIKKVISDAFVKTRDAKNMTELNKIKSDFDKKVKDAVDKYNLESGKGTKIKDQIDNYLNNVNDPHLSETDSLYSELSNLVSEAKNKAKSATNISELSSIKNKLDDDSEILILKIEKLGKLWDLAKSNVVAKDRYKSYYAAGIKNAKTTDDVNSQYNESLIKVKYALGQVQLGDNLKRYNSTEKLLVIHDEFTEKTYSTTPKANHMLIKTQRGNVNIPIFYVQTNSPGMKFKVNIWDYTSSVADIPVKDDYSNEKANSNSTFLHLDAEFNKSSSTLELKTKNGAIYKLWVTWQEEVPDSSKPNEKTYALCIHISNTNGIPGSGTSAMLSFTVESIVH